MSHKKFGPDRFSRFDVYWIQTNKQTPKQTDRQAKFIYRRKITVGLSVEHTFLKTNIYPRNVGLVVGSLDNCCWEFGLIVGSLDGSVGYMSSGEFQGQTYGFQS